MGSDLIHHPQHQAGAEAATTEAATRKKKIKQKHKNTKLLKPKQAKLILNILFSKKFCFGL